MAALTSSLRGILLSLCFLVSASEEISAKPGDTVILPCQAPRNTDIRSVEWRREEDILCLNRNPEQKDQCEEEELPLSFKDRVLLNHNWMKKGNASLILKNVTISDSGRYECQVDQSGARSGTISIIKLRVITDVTGKAGDTVNLPCNVTRNANIRAVEWSRDDETLCFNRNPENEDQCQTDINLLPFYKDRVQLNHNWVKKGNVSLILKNVTIRDSGTYVCRIDQSGTTRRKRELNLDSPPINTINLSVVEPGTNKDGGDEEKHGGNTTLIVVVVLVVLVLLLVVGIVRFWFYNKQRGSTDKSSYQQPPEQKVIHRKCRSV